MYGIVCVRISHLRDSGKLEENSQFRKQLGPRYGVAGLTRQARTTEQEQTVQSTLPENR